MKILHVMVIFLFVSTPAQAGSIGLLKPNAFNGFIKKYEKKKHDRTIRNRYNSKKNKHNDKYDKAKHDTYNGKQSTKKTKYDKNKHNKYNSGESAQFKKHTKKHTKKYYSKYNKYAK